MWRQSSKEEGGFRLSPHSPLLVTTWPNAARAAGSASVVQIDGYGEVLDTSAISVDVPWAQVLQSWLVIERNYEPFTLCTSGGGLPHRELAPRHATDRGIRFRIRGESPPLEPLLARVSNRDAPCVALLGYVFQADLDANAGHQPREPLAPFDQDDCFAVEQVIQS